MMECSGLGPHPPKVPLTVRVGVTGHRDLEDIESLRPTVASVLSMIRDMSSDLLSDGSSPYLSGRPILRLISPLAEGADRLVAQEALKKELGYDLQCPFPFPEEDYKDDFQAEGSVDQFNELRCKAKAILELDGSRIDCSSMAYEEVGRVVLRQSDVLIAIWDGKPARGRGGTAQVVSEALDAKIPVIAIDPAIPEVARMIRSVGPIAYGELTDLCERFRSLFLIPPAKETKKARKGGAELYFAEHEPSWTSAVVFGWLSKCFAWRLKRPRLSVAFERSGTGQWDPAWHSLLEAEVRPQVDASLRCHFAWADGLAELYANRYRSSFTLNYLLAAMAVLVAYMGHHQEKGHDGPLRIGWTVVELFFIVLIMILTFVGRKWRWHERWMDYRWLTESLRQMQYLALFARVMPSFRVPVHMDYGDPRRNWANWFLRAIIRNAGLVQVKVDEGYIADCRKLIVAVARSQARYHRKKGGESQTLRHRIHRAGEIMFGLAFLGCLVHLTHLLGFFKWAESLDETFSLTVGLLVLVSPAFGAAFAALLHHGEFERIASSSLALAEKLESTASQLSCPGKASTFQSLGHSAKELADVLVSELVDWRYVFLDKDIVLPG